jgi:cell division protein FtsI (penicillin-binding protein 3)
LPDFDPHNPSNPSAQKMFNRPTLGVYELGSVFKIFSISALLEKNEKNIFNSYDATKPLKRGRFTISDYHAEKRVMSVPEIFMVSSNIGTALIGEDVGTEGLKSFYKKLGLMTKPDVSLMEIGSPLYPTPWRDLNTLTASYGHGIAVSPLQLTTAFSEVVNGGLQVHPTFVLPQADPSKPASVNEERKSVRVVSEETSKAMRALLRLVVSDGTAKNAEVPGYEVGGKTGTAEQPGLRGYDKKRLISSFIATFPVTDPDYAVFVLIDEPHGTKETYGYATAGWTAAPAVGRVIQRMVSIMGIPPYENPQSDAHSGKQMVSHVEGVPFE